MELRDASKEGSAVHELASILLGWRFEPQMLRLQTELEAEKALRQKEVTALTARLMSEHSRAIAAEDDLEKIRHEHGSRGDELDELKNENDDIRADLAQLTKDRNTLDTQLKQVRKEIQTLRKENQTLRSKNEDPSDK